MNVQWEEMEVWNDNLADVQIGKITFKHKLLNAHYYFKFQNAMHYYMLLMDYLLGDDEEGMFDFSDKGKMLVNKTKFMKAANDPSFIKNTVYQIFKACFYKRVFIYEPIKFSVTPIKFLTLKPLLWFLDKLHGIKDRRISFNYFNKNTTVIEQMNLFMGILYTNGWGVKKKVDLLRKGYQDLFSRHLPRGLLARAFNGAESLVRQTLLDKDGRLINPNMIRSATSKE